MGEIMQTLAWTISLVVMGIVALAFLAVCSGASRGSADAGSIATTGYRWRARLFWFVVVGGVAITFGTLVNWPIEGHASDAAKPDVVIQATGHQWRWDLSQDTVDVGQTVEFQVTSADVNHGFAIYKDKTTMIAQTQAMPGFVNRLRVRFTEPGDYEVLCLEYCGMAHHAMRVVITVRAQGTNGENQ
jgi:cytochrome c oxidase subunit 2